MINVVVVMWALAAPAQAADNAMDFPLDVMLQDVPQGQQRAVAVVVRPPQDPSLQPATDDVQRGLVAMLQQHPAIRTVVLLEDPQMARGKQDMLLAQDAAQNGMELLMVVRVQPAEPARPYPDVIFSVLDGTGVELRNVIRNYADLWRTPLAEPEPPTQQPSADDVPVTEDEEEELGSFRDKGVPSDARILLGGFGAGAASMLAGSALALAGIALFALSYPVMGALGSSPAASPLGTVMQGGGCFMLLPLPCFAAGCVAFPLAAALALVAKKDQGRSCGPIIGGCAEVGLKACCTCAVGALCASPFLCSSSSPSSPPPGDDGYQQPQDDNDDAPPPSRPRTPTVKPRRPTPGTPRKERRNTKPERSSDDEDTERKGSRGPVVVPH